MRIIDQKLFKACIEGDLEEVKSLVEQGANIHASDESHFGWKPIYYATKYEHKEIEEFLRGLYDK